MSQAQASLGLPVPTTFEGVQGRGRGGWEASVLKEGAAKARLVGEVHLSSLHVASPLPCTLTPGKDKSALRTVLPPLPPVPGA